MPSSVLVAGPKIDIVAQPVIKPILSLNDNNQTMIPVTDSLFNFLEVSSKENKSFVDKSRRSSFHSFLLVV